MKCASDELRRGWMTFRPVVRSLRGKVTRLGYVPSVFMTELLSYSALMLRWDGQCK